MRDFTSEIDKSLDLLFSVEEKLKPTEKKKQLIEKDRTVYLQVLLFRIPFAAKRKRKFVNLRHSLYGDDPEICLFVPNRKTGVAYKKTTDELIDFCVDYYTEFLEKHKIKGISTVMPLKQLRSEYGTYDIRRKLTRRFDLFLCKDSLLYKEKFISSLGKIFKVAKKMPVGVSFPRDNADFDPEFKNRIKKAIFSSPFYVSRFSDNYSIPVGRISNTKEELKENLETVLQQLFKENVIPGGLTNVRALNLWPSQSKSIPLYFPTEFPVGMKTPHDRCRKKRKLAVEGELSTQLNKKVFVTPEGEVFVTNIDKNSKTVEESESDDDDSFKDDSDEENEEEKKQNLKARNKSTGEEEEEEEESESEDDEEIEQKEAKLLEERRQAEEESEDDEVSPRNVDEEQETNGNFIKTQKSKRKRKNSNQGDDGEANVPKKKKSGKAEQKGKVNKAKRKMLLKQEKFTVKEKINQKRKAKQKKV